jgi:hypothetical protein
MRLDLVAREGESPASDLTKAEPPVQLKAKQRGDASVLHVQVIPVLPQLLHLAGLLPERFVAARKAARTRKSVSKQIQLKTQVAAHYVKHVDVKLCKELLSFENYFEYNRCRSCSSRVQFRKSECTDLDKNIAVATSQNAIPPSYITVYRSITNKTELHQTKTLFTIIDKLKS